jgi:hypothetical protein
MATNPVPQPLTTTQLLSDLHGEFANIAHRTVTFSYGVLAVLVLVLGMAGAGAYMGLKSFDKLMTRADAQNVQYQTALASFQTTLAQHDAARAVAEAKVEQLEAQIAHRNTAPPPPAIQEALKPGSDAQTLANGLKMSFNALLGFGEPIPQGEAGVLLNRQQTQLVIESNEQGKKDSADLKDEVLIAGIEKQSNLLLTNDLAQCRDLQTESSKVIASYKKLAERTKWQRFVQGAEKVGILVAGGIIGHAL